MQQYAPIASSTHIKDSITPLNNNIASVASDFSGTAFPTTNLLVGMKCLRTDLNKLYQLKDLSPTWTQIADLSSDLSAQLAAKLTASAFGTTLASNISGATNKATPVDADEFPIADSAASFGLKATTWANIKTTLSSVFSAITSLTGSLKLPTGTTSQRDSTPSAGWMRFNSDLVKPEVFNGTAWGSVGGGATGTGTDDLFMLNGQTVTGSYTIPTGKNAGTFGPITVATGVTVTVPDGSTWTVV